ISLPAGLPGEFPVTNGGFLAYSCAAARDLHPLPCLRPAAKTRIPKDFQRTRKTRRRNLRRQAGKVKSHDCVELLYAVAAAVCSGHSLARCFFYRHREDGKHSHSVVEIPSEAEQVRDLYEKLPSVVDK